MAFALQGLAGSGGMFGQIPSSLKEGFPTDVRATATAFCYHQGAIWGGLAAPVLAYFADTWQIGLAIPMLVGTVFGAVNFIVTLLLSPETGGRELVPDLVVACSAGSGTRVSKGRRDHGPYLGILHLCIQHAGDQGQGAAWGGARQRR